MKTPEIMMEYRQTRLECTIHVRFIKPQIMARYYGYIKSW